MTVSELVSKMELRDHKHGKFKYFEMHIRTTTRYVQKSAEIIDKKHAGH